MLRGEGPQAASDDSDSAEFGPGCVHHIGGGGVLLAQKSVFTISTLQIVLCAGYRDLHCFPGPAQGPLRTPQHRRSAEGEQLGDFCCLLIPLAPPFLDAFRGVPAADFRAHRVSGEAGVQDRVPGTQRSKQPSWKLSQQLERGSASPIFPGCELG